MDSQKSYLRQEYELDDPANRPARRRLKILLAEDNEADVWLFCEAFDALRIDHDLEVVRNGEEALIRLRSFESLPEIILLDINMPKVDGFTVLTTVRADPRLRAIPVIMLSSSRAQADVRRAHELGANSYIYKSLSDFSDLVGDFDRYWLRRAELPMPPV